MLKRVVVTGLGCVSPLGKTASSTWENLIAGACGISILKSDGKYTSILRE
jgi:3-oxoacyl-[acyl-carrier-protein] synthase II